jgi:hypothetical protein
VLLAASLALNALTLAACVVQLLWTRQAREEARRAAGD